MTTSYSEEDFLLLSGIQHMAFCERQWALIHVEQVWSENVRTVEGKHLHERADDPFFDESRKSVRIVRSMPLVSRQLGLRGVADVVEFHQNKVEVAGETCRLQDRAGWWRLLPVEYKRGRPKKDDRDAVQLCAQAIALEEMLGVTIAAGCLFYAETKRRETIELTPALRQHTLDLAQKMHRLVREGLTPKAKKGKRCSQCSLVEDCQPYWMLKHRPVAEYLERMCSWEAEEE